MKRMINLGLVMAIFLVMCHPTNASESLIIAGTGDSQTLLRKLAAAYESNRAFTRIDVPDSVGSGGGIKAVVRGTAGLGRTARPLKPKERKNDIAEIPFALSPIVFAANPSAASVKNLTSDALIKIYAGVITDWREVGGNPSKIYPIDRESGDSSRRILETHLRSAFGSFKEIKSKGKIFFSTPETVEAVAQNRNTIGFMPLSVAKHANLHIFSIDSVFPDEGSVKNLRYPFASTFFLIKPSRPDCLAVDFLSFIKNPKAQQLMRAMGVIPIEAKKAE
ncbi:PstS family phosphate ABC transporter substrate-binding protein [Thermodesulfobacteriota bacterium]